MRTTLAALLSAALLMAGGCGSSRPETDEVKKTLESESLGEAVTRFGIARDDLTPEVIACLSRELVGSEASDDLLDALVAGEDDYRPTAADLRDLEPVFDTCGGAARPTAKELAAVLRTGQAEDLGLRARLSASAARCVARTLVGSKISDAALQSVLEGDRSFQLSQDDRSALVPLSDELGACVEKDD